jgi:hypothetical protein
VTPFSLSLSLSLSRLLGLDLRFAATEERLVEGRYFSTILLILGLKCSRPYCINVIQYIAIIHWVSSTSVDLLVKGVLKGPVRG